MIVKKSETWNQAWNSEAPFPHSLVSVGHYHQASGCHPEFDILQPGTERIELVTGGRGWLRVGKEWIEVTAGALIWNIGGDQTIARSDWENPYRCLAVQIIASGRSPRGVRRAPRLAWWHDIGEVRRFTDETVRWSVDDRIDRPALLASIYGRLLFQSRLWAATREQSELPEPLRRALALLEADEKGAGHPLRLREVARAVGWSLPYLHEVFRTRLRTTPHEIVLRRRLRLARERLAATDDPVKRIAGECGFGSAAAFCYAFKQRVGFTPLQYRRRSTSTERK